MEELEKKTLSELREIAKGKGLEKVYKYNKTEILEALYALETNKLENDEWTLLYSKTLLDLKDIARVLGIDIPQGANKDQVIRLIAQARNMDDIPYEDMTKKELVKIAKEKGYKSVEPLKKDEIIDILREEDQESSVVTPSMAGINTESLSDNATEVVEQLDDVQFVEGILEPHQDGFGFLRKKNYLPGEGDIYVSPSQIRRFRLRIGDKVMGIQRPSKDNEKYNGLLYVKSVNDRPPEEAENRSTFEKLTPIYPRDQFKLETPEEDVAMRIMDLFSPVGKGQRGLIVSPPKSGKTTLLKKIAQSITTNYPDVELIVLLIDERPEEVTDMIRSVQGEVVYSTFDELPKNHTKVAEMALERAKRLVEHGRDVVVLLDSITRLARAYNLTIPSSGRTLSGGLDPAALHKPKRFFGAARNVEGQGSLTILATGLVDTGSRMDDVIYEEFKGTGNMEIHLDRHLSERRIFPAIDIVKSGTRKEELLLDEETLDIIRDLRRRFTQSDSMQLIELILDLQQRTDSNNEFLNTIAKQLDRFSKK